MKPFRITSNKKRITTSSSSFGSRSNISEGGVTFVFDGSSQSDAGKDAFAHDGSVLSHNGGGAISLDGSPLSDTGEEAFAHCGLVLSHKSEGAVAPGGSSSLDDGGVTLAGGSSWLWSAGGDARIDTAVDTAVFLGCLIVFGGSVATTGADRLLGIRFGIVPAVSCTKLQCARAGRARP